jgi:hypothetical protein
MIIIKDSTLTANFNFIHNTFIDDINFTLKTNTFKLVDPSATNFHIPIYIIADKNVVCVKIEKLIIEIDRNIFFLKDVDNNILMTIGDTVSSAV